MFLDGFLRTYTQQRQNNIDAISALPFPGLINTYVEDETKVNVLYQLRDEYGTSQYSLDNPGMIVYNGKRFREVGNKLCIVDNHTVRTFNTWTNKCTVADIFNEIPLFGANAIELKFDAGLTSFKIDYLSNIAWRYDSSRYSGYVKLAYTEYDKYTVIIVDNINKTTNIIRRNGRMLLDPITYTWDNGKEYGLYNYIPTSINDIDVIKGNTNCPYIFHGDEVYIMKDESSEDFNSSYVYIPKIRNINDWFVPEENFIYFDTINNNDPTTIIRVVYKYTDQNWEKIKKECKKELS